MNRNFKYTLWLLALIITAALLSGCQTKKKSLDIQKQESSQDSTVKKESSSDVKDKSTVDSKKTESLSEQIKQKYAFQADSLKEDKNGNKTYYGYQGSGEINQEKQSNKSESESKKNNIHSKGKEKSKAKGKAKQADKKKVSDKHNTPTLSGQLIAYGIVISVMLIAIWFIKKQLDKAKKVKEAAKDVADLFL